MLIDSNTVLFDSVAVTSSPVTGDAVGLTSLFKPGRAEPIPVSLKVVEDFAGGTSITFKLTQADSETGVYSDVPGSLLTVVLADLKKGKLIGWRFLPSGVSGQWLKMVATPSGTFTSGKVFAAVVREDVLPYEAGMYIDGGTVRG